MRTKFTKLLCLLLTVMAVVSLVPVSVSAACSHSCTKVYTIENEKMHSYKSKCTKCGTVLEGSGYSGWENHSYNSSGQCTACGHCKHNSTKTTCTYENENKHSYVTKCSVCGKQMSGGWSDHVFSGSTCSQCGFAKSCSHAGAKTTYSAYSSTQHKRASKCGSCGITFNTKTESHSWSYSSWKSISSTQHSRTKSCVCGESSTETASHTFSGSTCTGCGYKKSSGSSDSSSSGSSGTTVTAASVSLSATGPSGTLGSAGGEIASETCPASYTVTASAKGCKVTKITYVKNGRTYSTTGSSVTISASTENEFTSTSFTAYTDAGVTATFTVNFKYVRKHESYYMWETSDTATIRSITGNGLNKALSHTMTIPNSYDSQGNLTPAQVAEIQGLIGRNDGLTYVVNYTRVIRVYTPASQSWNGQRIDHGSFDGNNSSEISACLSSWDWASGTREAIRQAASSYLTFTTDTSAGTAVSCEAVWINSATGRQLYSKTFGENADISRSKSAVVSVSYSEYPSSGSYVYERLTYQGDRTGSSTSQTYSQTITAASKSLLVTFYCHPDEGGSGTGGGSDPKTGSITVTAVDGDTDEVISSATVKCGSKTGASNPATFTGLSFGTYSVSASANGYGSASGSASVSASSPSKSVTLKLYKQAGSVTVTVRDSETRHTISGAYVSGAGKSGTTDSTGSVPFSGIDFGTYTFTASADGYSSNTGSATMTESSSSASITIYLDPEAESGSGTVTVKDSETRRVIGNAVVSGSGLYGTTNSRGTVSFDGLTFGSYTLSASKEGYSSGSGSFRVSRSSPSADLTIYLDPIPDSGTVTVTVKDDATHEVIAGASVSGASRSGTTDSSGRVSFGSLDFGSYTFTASKAGYASSSANASVSQSSPRGEITIYLKSVPTSGSVTVYVRDRETGTAITGAAVDCNASLGLTDSAGKVVYDGLAFGSYTFTASCSDYGIGSASASVSESHPDEVVTIYLSKNLTDLSVEGACDGDVYQGSTIMVSAEVTNGGSVALIPTAPASVVMTAKDSGGSVVSTQTKDVIIPADNSNLVWFSVTVPETNAMTFEFRVTAPTGVTETDLTNNADTVTVPVSVLPDRNCADAALETEAPGGFTGSVYTGDDAEELRWSVWEWEDGFVKKDYTARLDLSAELIPDETAGYRQESGSVWVTRSGYGVDTKVTAEAVSSSAEIVGTLKVDVFYPEHNYATAVRKSDRLERNGSQYVFKPLASSVSGARMHTVPLWFPDGSYSMKVYAFDVWCPAGMLSGYTNAKVTIDGDMYDDLYTN